MGILSWIVLGAIAGFLANMIVGGREGRSKWTTEPVALESWA
jgi:uncharacterized membrane protein YeaQ/YmgE (transglycosylase-associated protein family)